MRFTFGKRYICTYCGEPADTIDHTIPYSFFKDTKRNRQRTGESIGFMTYCCRECNRILGDRLFYTFQDRAKFVNTKLRDRYKKFMGVVWDDEEILELSDRLKEEVERSNRLNLLLRARVGWQSTNEFLDMLNDTMDRVYWSEELLPQWKEFFIDTDYVPNK